MPRSLGREFLGLQLDPKRRRYGGYELCSIFLVSQKDMDLVQGFQVGTIISSLYRTLSAVHLSQLSTVSAVAHIRLVMKWGPSSFIYKSH